uniref:Uncharacterized protein n=1 Tax=Sphaerodactylus townsendi TaxID=933632 RepID=A0ACB8GCA0_9SAUR
MRTVAPLKLHHLEEDVAAPTDKGGQAGRAGGGGAGLLFGSLEEVCSYSLVCLLWQLSDLSRCASEVFGGIQEQADSLGRRSAHLQRRLDGLRSLASRLDHRKVKIRICRRMLAAKREATSAKIVEIVGKEGLSIPHPTSHAPIMWPPYPGQAAKVGEVSHPTSLTSK